LVLHLAETTEEKRKRILSLAKEAVTKAYSTGEHALAQGINSYNELERTRNLLHERLEEWYGIYFPELETGSAEAYARFVIEAGQDKKQAGREVFERIFKERGGELAALAQKSIGNEPNEAEYAVMKSMAETEMGMIRLEGEIDSFLKEKVPLAMPNISYLIDYKLAAELLAKAGSLQKLAVMPASTIQLLGAEKALFRHLRSGSKSPKYGILFKLKDVTVAERWNKGKVARIFATKISIAARADAISKRFIGKVLKESLDKAISRIGAAPKPEGWDASHSARPNFRQNERFGGRPQRRPEFKKAYPERGPQERPPFRKSYERREDGPAERAGFRPERRPDERPAYRQDYRREDRPPRPPYRPAYGQDRRPDERPPFRKNYERRDDRPRERPPYRPAYGQDRGSQERPAYRPYRSDRPLTRPSLRPRFERDQFRPNYGERRQERPAYGQGRNPEERQHAFKPDHFRSEKFAGVKGRRPDGKPNFKDDGRKGGKQKKKRSV
jgi:nucleolar protein 56